MGWDVLACVALMLGVAAESTALPFVFGAIALIALDRESPDSRLWVPAVPLVTYAIWWLAYGQSQSDAAVANFAGLPSFAFDSLAAALGALTGLFTAPGSRVSGFDLSAGQAIAGAVLVALLVAVVERGYRPRRAAIVPLAALLSYWLLTAGVASADRVPYASRFIYIDVILLLLVFAYEIGVSRLRRQASLALSAICVFALLPNIRELTYGSEYHREQAEVNRAVMGAATLLEGSVPGTTSLEGPASVIPGQFGDLGFSLEQFAASRRRFGSPEFSAAEIAAATPMARAAADHLIASALSVSLEQAAGPPRPMLGELDAEKTGGKLRPAGGCLRFIPLASGAQLNMRIPDGGIWLRPAPGPPVPVGLGRFDDAYGVTVGPALPGRGSVLDLPPGRAARGWRMQVTPVQPLLLCHP